MGKYTFLKSKTGETVPAFVLPNGDTQPLHSMVDPKREAQRLVLTITEDTGFVIFLGLGGGFAPEAALEQTASQIVVIDFDKDAVAQLLSQKEPSKLLNNERFTLLVDLSAEEIKNFITENYKPSLYGGIKVLPLRTRTEADKPLFDAATQAIQDAIEIVSGDFSVQAHFGKRWFSNIIRNIKNAETETEKKLPSSINKAAIVAAGPSLDHQIPILAKCKSQNVFIICADTALPALLHNGIEPDTVVSIDCQHISYYHFLGCKKYPLILDIASPPLLYGLSSSPFYFSSGHPLAMYISVNWRTFPLLDTSGGNVTYACLSFAQYLGARHITLFGADFSFVNSRTYARGTYIYPFFEKKQTRFSPLEAQHSAFLYRSQFLPKENPEQKYYETSSLRFYRKKLEEKAALMTADISLAQGFGAPINLSFKQPQTQKTQRNQQPRPKGTGYVASPVEMHSGFNTLFERPKGQGIKPLSTNKEYKKNNISAMDFLEQYRNDIAALPAGCENYFQKLNVKERQVFTTLLPYAAFLKHRKAGIGIRDMIEEVKKTCIKEIDLTLDKN